MASETVNSASRWYRRLTATFLIAVLVNLGAALVIQVALIPKIARWPGNWKSEDELLMWGFFVLESSLVGALVAWKQPSNPIGWVFSLGGLFASVAALGDQWGIYALAVERGDVLGGRQGMALSFLGLYATWFTLAVLLPLQFPDASKKSRVARVVAVLGLTSALMWGSEILLPDLFVDRYALTRLSNPWAVPSLQPAVELISEIGLYGLFGATFLAVGVLFVRALRSKGVARQQMKLVAYTVTVSTIGLLIVANLMNVVGPGIVYQILNVLSHLLAFANPVAIGVAVLRFRLYDVDVVINKTLVYTAVIAILGGLYVGAVILTQRVLALATSEASDLATAASTLAAAGLFRPLRNAVQRFVDRRFYRSRYDAQQLISEFASRLQRRSEFEGIAAEVRTLVDDAINPTAATLWVRRRAVPRGTAL